MKLDKKSLLLYGVTDRRLLNGKSLCEQVECALKGGVGFVQMREKNLDFKTFCDEALKVKALCERYKTPFVINDNVEIAMKIDADGVHIGQSDEETSKVRQRIGKDKILGVSAADVEQALRAQECGADYLGVGAVFKTSSKDDADYVSYDMLKGICNAVSIPVVAIGGINADNAEMLKDSGICGAAVISAIFGTEDVEKASAELKKVLGRCIYD